MSEESGTWQGDLTGYVLGQGYTAMDLRLEAALYGRYIDCDYVRYETVQFRHEWQAQEFIVTDGPEGYTVIVRRPSLLSTYTIHNEDFTTTFEQIVTEAMGSRKTRFARQDSSHK